MAEAANSKVAAQRAMKERRAAELASRAGTRPEASPAAATKPVASLPAPRRSVKTPKAAVAPVVEAPVVEAPVVGAPVVEAPVVEAPVEEAPVVGAPVVGAPVVEAPVVEAQVEQVQVEQEQAPVVEVPVAVTEKLASADGEPISAGPAAVKAPARPKPPVRDAGPALKPLLDAGLLMPGEPLILKHKGAEHNATVDSDGSMIVADGAVFASPSKAALSLIDRQSCNGWDVWKARDRDGTPTLAKIRALLPS